MTALDEEQVSISALGSISASVESALVVREALKSCERLSQPTTPQSAATPVGVSSSANGLFAMRVRISRPWRASSKRWV